MHNGHLAAVDYTLVKRRLLQDFQRGLLSQPDICDAHPELLRAARNVGEGSRRPCPVCDEESLVLLAYVFADELKADNGRVWKLHEALDLAARTADGTCYVVEVCTDCCWNHLAEAFVARSAV